MTDFTPPERLYLQAKGHEWTEAITWSAERLRESDTEYIRADLVEAAKRQGAIEALEAVRKQANGLGWEPLAAHEAQKQKWMEEGARLALAHMKEYGCACSPEIHFWQGRWA